MGTGERVDGETARRQAVGGMEEVESICACA